MMTYRSRRYWLLVKDKVQDVFLRNVVSTFIVSVLSLMISVATSVIIARVLGPEKKGIISLAILMPSVLGLLLNGGISVSNVYFISSKKFDIKSLSANSITFFILFTVLGGFFLAGLFLTGWIHIILPDIPSWAILLSLAIFPFGLLSTFLSGLIQGLEQIVSLNRIQLIQSGLILLLTVLMVLVFHLDLFGALIASLLAAIAGSIGFSIYLRKQGAIFRPKWDGAVVRASLSFGLRGYIANVLQYFNYRLDVFIVNYYLGPTAVGIYAVSYGIAELLWYLPNAVSFAVYPRVSANRHTKTNWSTLKTLWITSAITILGGVLMAIFGRWLIKILFGDPFISAYLPLLAILPGVIALGASKVLAADIAGRGYPQYNSIISGIGLIVTIAADLILIPMLGVLGASSASSISYVVLLLLSIGYYHGILRRLPNKCVNY